MIDVKRAVSEKRTVSFMYYFDGDLWYQTEFDETFPVPVSDIGNATFLNKDKAILFMRYMNRWNKELDSLNRKRQAMIEYGKDDKFLNFYKQESGY